MRPENAIGEAPETSTRLGHGDAVRGRIVGIHFSKRTGATFVNIRLDRDREWDRVISILARDLRNAAGNRIKPRMAMKVWFMTIPHWHAYARK